MIDTRYIFHRLLMQVIPCRLSKESVTPVLGDRCIEEEVTALRVECAAAMLKLKVLFSLNRFYSLTV